MTKPKTLEQLRADKERAETQLAQEQHKLERLENRLSQGQIGVISAPICAFCRHSLGGFSIVSVQPCPLFSHSGSKLGQYGILIFFRKPSIFVAVSSDASVNNPSSVSSGASKTDLMLTATLAQDAMTVLDSALY